MPERIMGADGSTTAEIRAIAGGSNALYVYDTSAGVGTYSVLGSVEVSNIVKPVTVVGSPNYSLPVTGSQFVTQGTSPWNVIGSVQTSNLQNPHPITGSVQISSVVANIGVTQQTSPWINEGSVIQKGTWYNNILGSPNYSLPMIGSVQVSSIVGALPVGTAMLGSVINTNQPYNSNAIGVTWITNTSTLLFNPRVGRKYFEVITTGSYSSAFTSGRVWYSPSGTSIVQQGAERLLSHPWGLPYYEGSVTGITDGGSIAVAKYEVF